MRRKVVEFLCWLARHPLESFATYDLAGDVMIIHTCVCGKVLETTY